ncbi:hypothetical protein SAMN04487864_10533 [Succiniclasticum ruminis]|uniref:Uncharacterized protein n=1 Tax=Succiniclasticum ruminis TaxID=40841 RepID=A0A1G6KPM8_9FIRM|nr:hypothetical protein SAMN04487864_10533 [Succiniclasticum ruminis]
MVKYVDLPAYKIPNCILRSVTDVDAFQSGRFAKQNGRPETHKISSYSCGLITTV